MDPELDHAARLRELEERLIVTAEVVEKHFTAAVEVKRQLDDLVAALGAAADRAAQEASGLEPRFKRRAAGAVEVRDVGVE